MKHYNPLLKKELFWDMSIAESTDGVRLLMHRPVRKGTALCCDKPWEGELCNYAKIFHDGEKYRFYYRGAGYVDGFGSKSHHSVWCVAYSYDGKNFFRPDLGIFEYEGSIHNNIVMKIDAFHLDNFSITYDVNPACPPEERYKAFTGEWCPPHHRLHYYISADGLHFKEVAPLTTTGNFDSLNVCFWDARKEKYSLYLRGLHDADPAFKIPHETEDWVRDVRVSYSNDMKEWTTPLPLDYGEEDRDEIQLYTNNVMLIPDTDLYLAMPTRYIDRAKDIHNFAHLADHAGTRYKALEGIVEQRLGTAITDTMLMTSRDGEHFTRTKEAFYTPGPQTPDNWNYGDGFFAVGMAESPSDFEGEENELSLFVCLSPKYKEASFERYTIRKDGFFSYHAGFEEGVILTKPFTFDAFTSLHLNFATSAIGYVRIEVLDEDGNPLAGYDTGRLFGDSTNRPCDFSASLADLAGKPIKLRITMFDSDLYSFFFV